MLLQGLSGALFGVFFFYVLGSLAVRRFLTIDWYELLLIMAASFLVAVVSEVALGKLYYHLFGTPLWQYRVWPIHDGYTSALNVMIWPIYGYYWYLLSEVLRSRRIHFGRHWYKGILSGLDGPVLEILANGFFLLLYGTFYFYYLPDDMRHFTSIQVVPLYMVMGICLSSLLEIMKRQPRMWRYPAGFYLSGAAFVLAG